MLGQRHLPNKTLNNVVPQSYTTTPNLIAHHCPIPGGRWESCYDGTPTPCPRPVYITHINVILQVKTVHKY